MKKEIQGVTSVLIPLYNHEKFIPECLSSILLSDCSKIELIIVDDCSQDGAVSMTQKWLDIHKHKFVSAQLHINKVNLGITTNMNKLAGLARGEFITFLASDDILVGGSIDKQRDYLNGHPDKDFVFSNCGIINISGGLIKLRVVSSFAVFFLKYSPLLIFNVLFNWSIIWARLFGRREQLMNFGGYIEEHSHEDRWSSLKILITGRFGYMNEVVYLYRYRGEEGHPLIGCSEARRDFHDAERRLHKEAKGLLYCLLWLRRLPFKTNWGRWPTRLPK